jgi:protocatechuate 3,4-dioxygenase beta subunit
MKTAALMALLFAGTVWSCGTGTAQSPREREPVIGGPCENCEDVFVEMPDSLSWSERIALPGEPGEPLRIDGVVRTRDGKPVAGVIVYAYHTDHNGIYPRGVVRHGRLRGWTRTDERGRYRFDTIRPAGYPNTGLPQHIHMHIIEPGRGTYWISDIHFTDDPRLTVEQRRELASPGRCGSGLVTPAKRDHTWLVTRDIVLGKNIPGYPE